MQGYYLLRIILFSTGAYKVLFYISAVLDGRRNQVQEGACGAFVHNRGEFPVHKGIRRFRLLLPAVRERREDTRVLGLQIHRAEGKHNIPRDIRRRQDPPCDLYRDRMRQGEVFHILHHMQ